jgi:putative MFS transporter
MRVGFGYNALRAWIGMADMGRVPIPAPGRLGTTADGAGGGDGGSHAGFVRLDDLARSGLPAGCADRGATPVSVQVRPTEPPAAGDAPAVTGYQRRMLAAVAASTFFEGFDQAILALVAPYVARDFDLGPEGLGAMLSLIGVGAVLALLITVQADRYGRRRLLLFTIAGYGICTGLTALAQGPFDFVLYQLLARMFLFAELALAIVVVAEEVPAARRAFAVSLLMAAHVGGGVAAAFTLGPLTGAGHGWRAMYALGLIALPLLLILRLGIRETPHFAALDRALPAARIAWAPLAVWREPHRRPLVLCILLFGLIGALVSTFPSFYAYFLVNERAFAPAQVSATFGLALLMGIPAIPLSGWLLDRWGRRVVGVIGPLLGAAGILIAFNVGGSTTAITLAGMIGVFVGTSILPVQLVYIPELFPTSIRAIAAGWISNGAGRVLVISAPAATGVLAAGLGSVGLAASAMAVCGVAAAALVYAAMPETKGRPLE